MLTRRVIVNMDETVDNYAGTPNCPNCLTRMVLVGTDERPYWLCDDCEFIRLE